MSNCKEKRRQELILLKAVFDVYCCRIKYVDKFLQVKCGDIRPGGRPAHSNHCDSNVYFL